MFSKDQILALLGFSAAAWKIAPRDKFIGWDTHRRKENLHYIVNNSRFLILPWVRMKNLASRILGGLAKRLPQDWSTRYNYRPVLFETFVEAGRFQGTSYKAANWIWVGQTQGRGKLGGHSTKIPKKDIWLYPVASDYRQVLINTKSAMMG